MDPHYKMHCVHPRLWLKLPPTRVREDGDERGAKDFTRIRINKKISMRLEAFAYQPQNVRGLAMGKHCFVLSPRQLASRRQNDDSCQWFCHRSGWLRGDTNTTIYNSFVTAAIGLAATHLNYFTAVMSPQQLASRRQNYNYF